MTRSPSRHRGFVRIFGAPAIVAALIAAGLASGVLGDGIWDVISWIALSTPLAVVAFHLLPWPAGGITRRGSERLGP